MKIPVRYLRRQRPLLSCVLLLLTLPFIASAQPEVKLDGGNGGRNTLQGDLITPSGQRLDHPVMVRLATQRGEISTTSNGNGSFVFRQLSGGRYTVTIDAADGYAPAMEVVDISDSGSGGAMSRIGQTFTVQIHLRLAAGQPKASQSNNCQERAAIPVRCESFHRTTWDKVTKR